MSKSIGQKLADLIGGKTKAKSDELAAAKREAHARVEEIERRVKLIGNDGKERRRVELQGSADDLLALDRELASLRAEETQLRARAKELHGQAQAALVEEALKAHKETERELAEAVAAVERSHAEYRHKVAAANTVVARMQSARNTAVQVRKDAVDRLRLESALLERLAVHVHPGDTREDRSRQHTFIREHAAPGKSPARPRGPSNERKGEIVREAS